MILYLILLLCCIAIFAAGWYLGTASLMLYLKNRGIHIEMRDGVAKITLKTRGTTYYFYEKRKGEQP